jgi:hypothetical protein
MIYNRDRLLAILTGIVCALIFIGGTFLGALHSLEELGNYGWLAVSAFLIADLAVIWACIIDYYEDGNLMEWTSWIIKFLISGLLLFNGAAIAHQMINQSRADREETKRVDESAKVYKETRNRRLAENIHRRELQSDKEENVERSKGSFLDRYIHWPLFKYLPGIVGLFCILIMTFVSKISEQKTKESSQTQNQVSPQQISTFSTHSGNASNVTPISNSRP